MPYLDLSWGDRFELSTLDGASVDLIHDDSWHGGIYGEYRWGRSRSDLGALAGRLNTLPGATYAGFYLEYELTPALDLGLRALHDIGGAGTEAEAYFEWDLPGARWLEHSLEVTATAADTASQNRYYGVPSPWAERLGVSPYTAGSGWQELGLEYEAFVPTSQRTGVALNLEYGRLIGAAASSPLVNRFGAPGQFSAGLSFVYRFGSTGSP